MGVQLAKANDAYCIFNPYFHKIFYKFPLFSQNIYFPHIFVQFTFFASPYFDHDAFMHHALHVLDSRSPCKMSTLCNVIIKPKFSGPLMLHRNPLWRITTLDYFCVSVPLSWPNISLHKSWLALCLVA